MVQTHTFTQKVLRQARTNNNQMGLPIQHLSPLKVWLNFSSQKPRCCHSWFVQRGVLHVVSQPILEREWIGCNGNGSVLLTHPSVLHQTPSMEPLRTDSALCLKAEAASCRWGGRGGGTPPHIKGLKVGHTVCKTCLQSNELFFPHFLTSHYRLEFKQQKRIYYLTLSETLHSFLLSLQNLDIFDWSMFIDG